MYYAVVHCLFRFFHALLKAFLQQSFRNNPIKNHGHCPGAVVKYRLGAEVRIAFHFIVNSANILLKYTIALRAPEHKTAALANIQYHTINSSINHSTGPGQMINCNGHWLGEFCFLWQFFIALFNITGIKIQLWHTSPFSQISAINFNCLALFHLCLSPAGEGNLSSFIGHCSRHNILHLAADIYFSGFHGQNSSYNRNISCCITYFRYFAKLRWLEIASPASSFKFRHHALIDLSQLAPGPDIYLVLLAPFCDIGMLYFYYIALFQC